MRPRTFLCITLLLASHSLVHAQTLTNQLPSAVTASSSSQNLPEDPGEDTLPADIAIAQLQPAQQPGTPVHWDAEQQTHVGDTWTLTGNVIVYYRDYVLRADKVVYNQAEDKIDAEGHLQVTGGAKDLSLTATSGTVYPNAHQARFQNVVGAIGVRRTGSRLVYTTGDPFLFTGRVLTETEEGSYHIHDGSMTSCRLPDPDWRLAAHEIDVVNEEATLRNAWFEALRVPLFYLPWMRHGINDLGRESGFLIPVMSESTTKGFVIGEQVYWALNRSMDLTVGSEFYSKRGWAPNGMFRWKGRGLDFANARFTALLDRGIYQTPPTVPVAGLANQGGVDIVIDGRHDLSENTRITSVVEYLSSYVYRLAFEDNFALAINSQVASNVALTHVGDGARAGWVSSGYFSRFQSFASTTSGDEIRVMHLPALRLDMVDSPLGTSGLYYGLGASVGELSRAEPSFHAHSVGRVDLNPRIEMPLHFGSGFDAWDVVPSAALRYTFYTDSQRPDLTGKHSDIPFVQHEPLTRSSGEVSLDIRPPAMERDFALTRGTLRHVIEPELFYRYVGGIGDTARNVLRFDTTDIAADTNEAGYSFTQRFFYKANYATDANCAEPPATTVYIAPSEQNPCSHPNSWATWQIEQKFFFNRDFGGALIPGHRNVFDSTLDLSGISYLLSPRSSSPLLSRMRFEAIPHLRVEWDLDYDTKAGRMAANNLYSGYSIGRTTFGIGHALLNAEEQSGTSTTVIRNRLITPFLAIGNPASAGLSFAANAGYDFAQGSLQYGAVEAVYNWNCCGIQLEYRRYSLGTTRDETQYRWNITFAGLANAGNLKHSVSAFPDPLLPPAY